MIFQHIKSQTFQNGLIWNSLCERHFENHFHSFSVAGFYHILQFIYRTFSCGIGFLWRKIICRSISPVIDLSPRTFVKFIDRHTLNLVNPQFFQIWEFFDYTSVSSFIRHLRGAVFCKSSYMNTFFNG